MSKRQAKAQASSSRAIGGLEGFGSAGFGTGKSTVLSYVQEPPNYSSISDPNIVVALKSLTKKDPTTKAKALEDLQSYTNPIDFTIEDGLLEAWVKLFPRLTIDTSRRIRQLSHQLNGPLCSKCGKRIAKHLSRIAGPWLAGTLDNDRAVSTAAKDALHLVFPTPEKLCGFRKTFQSAILEYCRDTILNETAQTLTDERTTSPDDAVATYARVVSTSLSTIANQMTELNEVLERQSTDLYQSILSEAKFWDFITNNEAGVRGAFHKLIQTYAQARIDLLNPHVQRISKAYVYNGLASDQTNSVLAFMAALEALTRGFPEIWTDAYSGKKTIVSRLSRFLENGSQGASSNFWLALPSLLRKIPPPVFPDNVEEVVKLVSVARSSISRREEQSNASTAWPTYLVLVELAIARMTDEHRSAVLQSEVMPLIRQYLDPTPDAADWQINVSTSAPIITDVAKIQILQPKLVEEWPVLADKIIENAKMSQPEQSKDFEKSQEHIGKLGERWAILQSEFFNKDFGFSVEAMQLFREVNTKILRQCANILANRRGKPYGAAAVVRDIIRHCGKYLLSDKDFSTVYKSFVTDCTATAIFSPSRTYFVDGLYATQGSDVFPDLFELFLRGVLGADATFDEKVQATFVIFPADLPLAAVGLARDSQQLQDFVAGKHYASSNLSFVALLGRLAYLGVILEVTIFSVLSELIMSLSLPESPIDALLALEAFTRTNDGIVRRFMSGSNDAGNQLLPNIMQLEQSPDEQVASKASMLAENIISVIQDTSPTVKYRPIIQSLEKITENSLSIDAIHQLAARLVGPSKTLQSPLGLLPSVEIWASSLADVLKVPKASLALYNPLGGILHLVEDIKPVRNQAVAFDQDGLSQPLRIAMYVSRLLATTDLLNNLGDIKDKVLILLWISICVAQDNISIIGSNDMWRLDSQPDVEDLVHELVEEVVHNLAPQMHTLLNTSIQQILAGTSAKGWLQANIWASYGGHSVTAYYEYLLFARASDTLLQIADIGPGSEKFLQETRQVKDVMQIATCLVAFQASLSGTTTLNRYCSELAADLTDVHILERPREGLEKLSLLNIILRMGDDYASTIAKQRIIFLAKNLLEWLRKDPSADIIAEICSTLNSVLPGIVDLYGETWEQALDFITKYWQTAEGSTADHGIKEDEVIMLTTTLRLFATLVKLSKTEDANDDLIDALKEREDELNLGLVRLLTNEIDANDEVHLPLLQAHELLARQIDQLPDRKLDTDELYPMMYAPSYPLQQAAFKLLHKQIPKAQEQISLHAALDNKTAKLPDELLSLILEYPKMELLTSMQSDDKIPRPLRAYLNSWLLIFDHFSGSSQRVKDDYINQLNGTSYLSELFELTFKCLGHSLGKPVDVSKFDIESYVPGVESDGRQDMQWLLTHLYYLALKHMPSMAKGIFLTINSRQTSPSVEKWTAKYISPLIIDVSLREVADWAENSIKQDPEYEKISVKVGRRSREINVGYALDEQTMAIRVTLPEAYPLQSAKVDGISRVGVNEEQWQSWLMNCQGVILFSNGSIVDGLTAWRKNVAGALKGQTECAICYSIISGDKQLPTKRCPTCRHSFHSSCLFRWFKTSNANTCPLCRNAFSFN